MSVAERIAAVNARIAAACAAAGRDPRGVELLAVSKTRGPAEVRDALAAGQRAFGENRVQELAPKARALAAEGVAWHMIGSVQTNKVRDLLEVPGLVLVHSLDRVKLADALQCALDARGEMLDVLLQANATGEASKHGAPPAELPALTEHVLARCPRLRVCGLMAMGPLAGDPAPAFARSALLHAALRERFALAAPILSLGMTGDLEAAIAAGSTLVRVGTGVFGERA